MHQVCGRCLTASKIKTSFKGKNGGAFDERTEKSNPHIKNMGDPFHLSPQTNDWIFYVSRPTLEMLRKPGKEGLATYTAVKETIEKFLPRHPSSANYRADVEPFTIGTLPCENKDHSLFCTLSYPFDIRDEIDNKLGVVLHVSEVMVSMLNPLILKPETIIHPCSMKDSWINFARNLRA